MRVRQQSDAQLLHAYSSLVITPSYGGAQLLDARVRQRGERGGGLGSLHGGVAKQVKPQ